jgi:hypothetical protein
MRITATTTIPPADDFWGLAAELPGSLSISLFSVLSEEQRRFSVPPRRVWVVHVYSGAGGAFSMPAARRPPTGDAQRDRKRERDRQRYQARRDQAAATRANQVAPIGFGAFGLD